MKPAMWIVVVLVVSHGGSAYAADPARVPQATSSAGSAQTPAAANPDAIVPKREVSFVVSQEEAPMPFKPGVPGLLDQRFAVSFRVACKFPGWQFVDYSLRSGGSFPKEVQEILTNRSLWALEEQGSRSFSALVERVPPQRLPPASVLADLRAEDGFANGGLGASGGTETMEIYVCLLARTPQQAETLARASLTLIDYGWLARAYPRYAEAATYLERWLPENRAKLEKATRELSALQNELDKMKEFAVGSTAPARSRSPLRGAASVLAPNPVGEFATLRSQIQLVAVDMAGAKARIDACNKILGDKSLTPNRANQVENLKTAAEIELVGLAAKEEALKGLIEKTSQYSSLSQRAGRLAYETDGLKRSFAAAESALAALRAMLQPKTFFGQVVSLEKGKALPGTILISKIKWTEPKPSNTPQPPQR